MSLFLLTFGVVLLAMAGLAAGLLLKGKSLEGSCGGNAIMKLCRICKIGDKL